MNSPRALHEGQESRESKQAEAALRESEEQWKAAFECYPVMFFIVDAEGTILSLNTRGAHQLGYEAGELIGKPALDVFHEDDREFVRKNTEACLKNPGCSMKCEARKVRKDGTVIWVRETATALLLKNKPALLMVCEDITDRKEAEEAVRRSEKELRDLVGTTPSMAFAMWPDGANEYVSRQWFEFSGLSPEQTVGSGWQASLHPDDAEQHMTKWRVSRSTGGPFENEARHRDAHGNYRWLLVRAVPLRDEQGNILKWYGSLTDIEDRKRIEEVLRRNEAYLAEAQRLSHTGSWARGADAQTPTYWSEENFRIWGFDPEQGLPDLETMLQRIHPEDRNLVIEATRKAAREKCDYAASFRIVLPDGRVKHIDGIGHPVYGASGKLLEIVGTHLDVTERRQTEALLAGEKRILEMVAKRESLAEILEQLCRLLEEQAHGVRASILLVDANHLRFGAAPSLPKSYTAAIDGVEIGPCGGSCAMAAYRGEPVIVEDVASDPPCAECPAAGMLKSLRAWWSTPIFSGQGKVIATFTLYYHEQRKPAPHEKEIVEQIAHLAGIAIERKLTHDRLATSEANLAEAQRLTHTGSFVWDVKTGKALYLSDECYRIYGFDPDKGESAWEERLERINPEDRAKWQAAIDRAIKDKSDYEMEKRLVLPNGVTKYVHAVGHPISNSSGEIVQFMGSVTDITERKRAEALLAGEKQLLEMIATGVKLREILHGLCLVVEEQRNAALASVSLLNPDGVHLDVIAGPNLPEEWRHQMEKLPMGPPAGSWERAAYRGSRVIATDIANEPEWDIPEHRESALKHGLRGSWSSPVLSSKGKVLGTFCIYYREPRTPSAQDIELMELATNLARVAIERDHAEEALRASEQLARSHVEVIIRGLDVLATESVRGKFIGEMLRTIGRGLRANRLRLWLRDPEDDSLRIHVEIKEDQQVPPDADHPGMKNPRAWKENTLFEEMLFTKSPLVVDDVEHDSRIEPGYRDYLAKRGCKRLFRIPIFMSGEVRGFIGVEHCEAGAYRPEEIELAQALAHQVMLALELTHLAEQERQAAILKERTRMARNIHDTLAQGFTGVIVQMEVAEEALLEQDSKHALRHVRRARELARESLGEARRSVHALRPQALEKGAFAEALKTLVQNMTAGTSLRANFQLDGEPRDLLQGVEENLFHIGREALTNTLKHARAMEFKARLIFDSDAVRLELRDNGRGFVVNGTNGRGFGLIGMKERAEQIGGALTIASEPGAGTTIVALSPYPPCPGNEN